MKRVISVMLLSFVLLGSCNMGIGFDNKLTSLYKQRIANSNLVIYEYTYVGGFVSSGSNTGFVLLDSLEEFSLSKAIEEHLPSTYFSSVPSSNRLDLIRIAAPHSPVLESDTFIEPIREYSEPKLRTTVMVKEYNITYGSPKGTGSMEYEFDSIMETQDSLIFYNIVRKFGAEMFASTTAFPKGNIKAIANDEGKISEIEIKKAIIHRGDIYEPKNPFELVFDRPIVGRATYGFTPTRDVTANSLSDLGIFKRVR